MRRIVLGHIPLRDSDGNPPPEDQITNQPIAPVQQLPSPQPYPAVVPTFPVANPVYPAIIQPYPGASPPCPEGNPAYPGYSETHIPGVNPSYPAANPPFSGANPLFPGTNPPFPGTNSPFSGANPPIPEENPQPSNESFGFVAPVSSETQNVAVPSLPPTDFVPYPTNVSKFKNITIQNFRFTLHRYDLIFFVSED